MTATIGTFDIMRSLMADADELVGRILDCRFGGESCNELVDDLRDTIDQIDSLAATLNGEAPE